MTGGKKNVFAVKERDTGKVLSTYRLQREAFDAASDLNEALAEFGRKYGVQDRWFAYVVKVES